MTGQNGQTGMSGANGGAGQTLKINFAPKKVNKNNKKIL
jgi:hypothetical protein